MTCRKASYANSRAAIAHLRAIRRRERRALLRGAAVPARRPIRTYLCQHCGLWHLTSQPLSTQD